MKFNDQKFTRQDGKLHIFKRPNSPFWWCGFHHQGKYIRTSTKCRLRSDAIESATDWYLLKLAEIRVGKLVVKKEPKFKVVAKEALKSYWRAVDRGERSEAYVKGIEQVLESRVLPFFGEIYISDVDQVQWRRFKDSVRESNDSILALTTFHQYRNAVRVVLNEAYEQGELKTLPVFKDQNTSTKTGMTRTYFTKQEYQTVYLATRANIKRLKNTRWHEAAKELHDYVLIMVNTGLRVGEAKNVRFCDVEIFEDKNYKNEAGTEDSTVYEYLLIKNIKGKRGTGSCRSHWGGPTPFRRICERNPDLVGSKEPIFKHHHRDMFNKILVENDLKFTNDREKRRRDFLSLRHTYICFRLMAGMSVFDVAANCRTSVTMIEQHYARHLPVERLSTISASKRFESD